jgi:hypothetical protein
MRVDHGCKLLLQLPIIEDLNLDDGRQIAVRNNLNVTRDRDECWELLHVDVIAAVYIYQRVFAV